MKTKEDKILNSIEKYNSLADMNDALEEDVETAIAKYSELNKSS